MNISVTVSDEKTLSINVGDERVVVLRETDWFYKGKRLYIDTANERDVKSFNNYMYNDTRVSLAPTISL